MLNTIKYIPRRGLIRRIVKFVKIALMTAMLAGGLIMTAIVMMIFR